MTSDDMDWGVVVMLDALGFKGIWERYDPHTVVETLKSIQEATQAAEDVYAKTRNEYSLLRVKSAFLSDTVFIGVGAKVSDDGRRAVTLPAVNLAAQAAAALMRAALDSATPLLYRGAVTIGRFLIDGNFVIGEAIDHAARACDLAEAAIVSFTPQTREWMTLSGTAWKFPREAMALAKVPMKEPQEALHAYTITPFRLVDSRHDRYDRLERMLTTFGNAATGTVALKRANTESWAQHILNSGEFLMNQG